jgi:hypothetical protein
VANATIVHLEHILWPQHQAVPIVLPVNTVLLQVLLVLLAPKVIIVVLVGPHVNHVQSEGTIRLLQAAPVWLVAQVNSNPRPLNGHV